jgi:hypothetical protein
MGRDDFHLGRDAVRTRAPYRGQLGWTADAHPWNGLWRFVVDLPDGTKCNNDGVAPGMVTFKIDAPRQEGTFLTTNPAPWCPFALAPGYSHPVYFTLTRI